MMPSWKMLLVAVPAMIVLDFLWLGFVARSIYRTALLPLGRMSGESLSINLPAAFGVYLLLALGIMLFVLPKVVPGDRVAAFVWGAAFGLITYGIYDLTNYAILRDWPLRLVAVDMLWGTFLVGIVSWLLAAFSSRFSSL